MDTYVGHDIVIWISHFAAYLKVYYFHGKTNHHKAKLLKVAAEFAIPIDNSVHIIIMGRWILYTMGVDAQVLEYHVVELVTLNLWMQKYHQGTADLEVEYNMVFYYHFHQTMHALPWTMSP